MDRYPSRIVCLTEETTETLYLLGEGDRVVGVSGYTVRPPEARRKPRVSSYLNARYDKIDALDPDLILAFSDLQATIAADLAKRGHNVMLFNQRSVAEILQMIRMVGALVGRADRGEALAAHLEADLDRIREAAPIFPELRTAKLGKDRIVTSADVARRVPDVVIASWCGKAVRRETIATRDGWQDVPAVRHDHIYEVKSALILQPGPAALTDGVTQLLAILTRATQAP